MKIHVVNHKKTKIDSENVMSVECGVTECCYEDKMDAIQQIWKLTDDKFNEHIEENVEEMEKDQDNENIYRDSNKDGSWQLVHCFNEDYEYWTTEVEIKGKETK